jgi:fumarate hydratase subunit beta
MEYRLRIPIPESDVRKLKIGDIVYVTGTMVTARDQAHRRALALHKEGKPIPIDLRGGVVFHCGPVVKKKDGGWEIVAAGPTTSTRMELFQAEFIEAFRPSIIVGKGGMGPRTAEAMKKFGAVYCDFTGGAAVLAAKAVESVRGVEWFELGIPEAMWILEVKDFGPLLVTIDSHGNSHHANVAKIVEENRPKIYSMLGITSK